MKTVLFKLSTIILAGGSSFDSATSLNQPELNPAWQRGAQHQFTYSSFAERQGIVYGGIALQYWWNKKYNRNHEHDKIETVFTISNFAMGGIEVGTGIRNLGER